MLRMTAINSGIVRLKTMDLTAPRNKAKISKETAMETCLGRSSCAIIYDKAHKNAQCLLTSGCHAIVAFALECLPKADITVFRCSLPAG